MYLYVFIDLESLNNNLIIIEKNFQSTILKSPADPPKKIMWVLGNLLSS